MSAAFARVVLLVALALGATTTLLWQRERHRSQLAERDRLIAVQREQARLRERSDRRPAPPVSPDEPAHLRQQAARLDEARREHALLERALAVAEGRPLPPAPPETPQPQPPLTGPRVAAAEWQFAGNASPLATFQSAVWSATRGETEQLVPLLAFDPAARKGLEATFAALSEETRAQYGSPEQLAATLLAAQVPHDLAAFGQVDELQTNPGDVALVLRLEREHTSRSQNSTFLFRRSDAGWRLVVPDRIVAGLARALHAPGKP